MADVITKLRINENFHDGRVVITQPKVGSGIQTELNTGHDYYDRINSGAIDAKYTTRFDDPMYYTA